MVVINLYRIYNPPKSFMSSPNMLTGVLKCFFTFATVVRILNFDHACSPYDQQSYHCCQNLVRTYHHWIVYFGVAVSTPQQIRLSWKTFQDHMRQLRTQNYSTVICTNNILTTVITLMIISGASMIKVYTNVANVEKHLIMRWHSVNIGNFIYKYKQSV